jgi:hypothetical protein
MPAAHAPFSPPHSLAGRPLARRVQSGDNCSIRPAAAGQASPNVVKGKYVLETCKGPTDAPTKALVCDNARSGMGDGCGHEVRAHAAATAPETAVSRRQVLRRVELPQRMHARRSSNPKAAHWRGGDVAGPARLCATGPGNGADVRRRQAVRAACHGAIGCQTAPERRCPMRPHPGAQGAAARKQRLRHGEKNVLVCQGGRTRLSCTVSAARLQLPGSYSTRCDKASWRLTCDGGCPRAP